MKLSILIVSHFQRKPLLMRMLRHLEQQKTDDVEILFKENDGNNIKGIHRNYLIDNASGEYCAFVDDDDIVSDDYVSRILTAIQSSPDICTMTGIVTSLCNHVSTKFVLSTNYSAPFSLPCIPDSDGIYKRCASHLNPIRTEIARQIRFPENNIKHEDNGYSERLKQLNRKWNEAYIDSVLYHYFSRINL